MRFKEAINSLPNVLPIPVQLHRLISVFYSSPLVVNGLRYPQAREYIQTLSWERQYEIGLALARQVMSLGKIIVRDLPL